MTPMPADMPPVSISTDATAHGPISAGPARVLITANSGDYVVKPGDTLYDIAADHDTSVTALVKANSLRDGGRWIQPGQRLHLSAKGSSSTSTPTKKAGTSKTGASHSSPNTVTVRPGDTLSGIAAKYNVSVASLALANSIFNTRLIHPGQRLEG